MKRLIKKSEETITCYHASPFKNFDSIMTDEGLVPQKRTGWGISTNTPIENFNNYSFFTTTLDHAIYIARAHFPDLFSFIVEAEIPVSKLLPDDNDDKEAKTWQDSAKSIQQVKVKGQLDGSYFKKVYLYNRQGNKITYETTINENWYADLVTQIKNVVSDNGMYAIHQDNKSNLPNNVEQEYEPFLQSHNIFQNEKLLDYEMFLFKYFHKTYMYINSIYGKITEYGDVNIFDPIIEKSTHNFSLPIEGASVEINLTIDELKNIYSKKPNLIDNIKKTFDGLSVIIDNQTYNLDDIINEISIPTTTQQSKIANLKRLIRKSEPITLYHGTNLLSLDEILQTGIAAGIGEESAWTSTNKTQTFFTTDIELAQFYGYNKYKSYGLKIKDCVVVMEIDFDTDYLEPDKDDVPYATTWEESNGESNQVATNGSVMANQIKKLYFCDTSYNVIEQCTTSQYLSDPESIKNKIYSNNKKSFGEINNKAAEEIIDEMRYMGEKINKCVTIIGLRKQQDTAETIQPKLDKEYHVIYQVIEKINALIKKYNEDKSDSISLITVKEKMTKPNNSFNEELRTLFIYWNECVVCTNKNEEYNQYEQISNSFEEYIKKKQVGE